jgi:hypothetical protein
VRTSRGEADFEGVGGESKRLMREGRIGACYVKHGGCASRRSESEKEDSRDGGRGWKGGSYSEVKSSDLPRRGDHARKSVPPKPQAVALNGAINHDL